MLIRCKDYENSQKGGGGLGKACVVYYYEKLVDPNTRSERYVSLKLKSCKPVFKIKVFSIW